MYLKTILVWTLSLSAILLSAQTSLDLALEHLQASGKYTAADLADVRVSDEYQSKHSGMTHLYLQQRYQGIDVKYALTNFNIKDRTLKRAAGDFIAQLQQKVTTTQAQITAAQALQKVMTEHQILGALPELMEQTTASDRLTTFAKGTIASEPIKLRLIYLEVENVLHLCWEVSLYEKSCNHWWEAYVDAQSGATRRTHDQVLHCSFHNGKNTTRTKTAAKKMAAITLKKNAMVVDNSYNVYAYPVESPNHGSRSIQTSPWNDAGDAGSLGWHDDGSSTYTHTRGNNVDAYHDQNASNGPTNGNESRADGGDNLEFDFPIDLTIDPESDPDPYITNLFYWNNLMHDVWYQYGFDEAAGNFQEDNQGRGGDGSDYVRAEAQDGASTDNANFSTPTDGGNPRMQMFLWISNGELLVNAPENVAGIYDMREAGFGGEADPAIIGDVVEVDAGGTNPTEACVALLNADDIDGKIALIDRGTCEFGTKCLNAQNAGAIAVIICNDVAGLLTMGPGDDGGAVTIPAVMIRQGDCATLRAEISNGLNVKIEAMDIPNLDGDLDNGIIAHEYGHGISIRLTGGPSNNGCLNNEEQMGEGWSDFFGIWMTIENGDLSTDVRGVGTYALGEATTDDGIRPAPYTTDMSINDYTYGNLDDSNISRPHGIGFIWCTMLWDLNWALVNEHGLDLDLYNGNGGNNIAAQLIMDGLKGQPCSPGFVDGRDAIIEADEDNNGGANRDIIWNVFARRGLGASAAQGSSDNRSDQTEAFDLPADVPFINEDDLFNSAPLPVALMSFKALAEEEQQQILIYWSTASEQNNQGFDLQRRTEGSTAFESIAWLTGQVSSSSFADYAFTDQKVKGGIDYYYRLRQVDHDGTETYSDVVNARLNSQASDIKVFPNPSPGLSTVQFPRDISGQVYMEVLNTQGQVIGVQLFETNGGAELEVDLSQQAEGVYFLKFEINDRQIVKQIILRK